MSTQANNSVFDAALALPSASRAELAELLWESLADESADSPLDSDILNAWLQEAKRRMQAVDEGNVELLPGDQVMSRLRQRMNP